MITSLLELQTKKIQLEKKVREYANKPGIDSVEYANAEWNLRQTKKNIESWGTQQAVYRIC